MSTVAFNTFSDHCRQHQKGPDIRNHAFCAFMERYVTVLESHRTEHGKEPTPEECDHYVAVLLAGPTVHEHVQLAENLVKASFNSQIRDLASSVEHQIQRIASAVKGQFWKSTAASVMGNVLYAIVLIVIFYIGQEQIRSWLSGLSDPKASTTAAVSQGQTNDP